MEHTANGALPPKPARNLKASNSDGLLAHAHTRLNTVNIFSWKNISEGRRVYSNRNKIGFLVVPHEHDRRSETTVRTTEAQRLSASKIESTFQPEAYWNLPYARMKIEVNKGWNSGLCAPSSLAKMGPAGAAIDDVAGESIVKREMRQVADHFWARVQLFKKSE